MRFERLELELLCAVLDSELRRREQRLRNPVPLGWVEYRALTRLEKRFNALLEQRRITEGS